GRSNSTTDRSSSEGRDAVFPRHGFDVETTPGNYLVFDAHQIGDLIYSQPIVEVMKDALLDLRQFRQQNLHYLIGEDAGQRAFVDAKHTQVNGVDGNTAGATMARRIETRAGVLAVLQMVPGAPQVPCFRLAGPF